MLLLALGSCTRLFRVIAGIEDGRITFRSEDDDRTFDPWCWNNFTIVDDRGHAAWEFEVPYGAFSGGEDCGPNFPIRYGQSPERAETMVAPQHLQIDRLYVINGHASGILEGAFRIERTERGLKVRNLDPDGDEALALRDEYFAWQRDHDPPRISQTPTSNAAFIVQAPPEAIPENSRAGSSGKDELTWVLRPDEWWNLPSLSYQSLTGVRTSFNLWCRYTGGPIYVRVPAPAIKGAPIAFKSGTEHLAIRLIGAGSPDRKDRVDAILEHDSPVLRNFAETGDLTVEIAQNKLELSAIDGKERAVIKRFFQLCSEPGPAPSPAVDASDNEDYRQ